MSTWKQGAFFSKELKDVSLRKNCMLSQPKIWKRKSCLFYGSRKVFLLASPFGSKKTWNRNDFYQNYTFPSNESAPFLLKQPSLFHPKQGQYSLSPTLQPHHAKNTSNLNATPNSTFQSTSMNSNQLEQRSKPLCHSVILLGSWRDPYINLLQSYVAGIVLYIKNHQPKWTAKLLTSTSSTSQKNSKKKTHQVLPRSTLPASWCFFPTSPHPSTTPLLAKHHLPPWPPLLSHPRRRKYPPCRWLPAVGGFHGVPRNQQRGEVTTSNFFGAKMMDHHGFKMTIRNPKTQCVLRFCLSKYVLLKIKIHTSV